FCREAVFWKQLAHPNIVPFLGVSQSHNLCIVSEWMAFGDVITYLQKFPRANRRQLVTDVACGLEYMHASAMIHGDIKGRNILVDGSRRARLGDFGLARTVLGPKSFTPSISRSGGTMRYMAPELAENSNPGQPTRETDVYAFAMASWEIFCGEQIFPHLPEWTVFARVLSGERPLRP
ncbi:kinase-like protein, partial [Punctularia strigosozonata HHB-11173 SS5]|uniref:kinase-like protein n=1 Tax=Punctularia strigosozonata (strain HHB-11173) TaxID=741275 RepID=UPI0004417C48